jgi:hypothetical protein
MGQCRLERRLWWGGGGGQKVNQRSRRDLEPRLRPSLRLTQFSFLKVAVMVHGPQQRDTWDTWQCLGHF